MPDIYLLVGMFEHDEQELALRRQVIYQRNLFMSEYFTTIIGDIYNRNRNELTGIISTHLSNNISHTKTFGLSDFPIEQKLPLCFGTMRAIKNYTQIQLIHSFDETRRLQLISAKKKGINLSLDGNYKGTCFYINQRHIDMINFYMAEAINISDMPIEKIIEATSKGSHNKREVQFKLEHYANQKPGGRSSDSPEPIPTDKLPQFHPELA